MAFGIDPKVDYAFKNLFGSPANTFILIDLLNAVLQLDRPITDVVIQNPFGSKATDADKLYVVDVLASDDRGWQFLVEMQMVPRFEFRDRVMYYWARHFSAQLAAGEGYDELKPVFMINFVNGSVFPEIAGHHSTFHVREARQPDVRMTQLLEIHFVELTKFGKGLPDLRDAMDQWCYLLRHGEYLEPATMPPELQSEPVRRAVEALDTMKQINEHRILYEARHKAALDALASQWTEEKVLEKGEAIGILKGKLMALLQIRFGDAGVPLADRVRAVRHRYELERLERVLADATTLAEFEKAFP